MCGMDTDADFADIEKNINNVIERIVDALRGYTDEVITVVNMMLSIQTNLKSILLQGCQRFVLYLLCRWIV